MKQLDGQPWGQDLQKDFAARWARSRGIAPEALADRGFSARDRLTRWPRWLGLVHKPSAGRSGNFVFTPAGNALLEAIDPGLVLQRQLAKLQFPSPLHKSGGFEDMYIRPLQAVIWLMNELGSLSKDEIAMFVLSITRSEQLPEVRDAILQFRTAVAARTPGVPRAEYREEVFLDRVEAIYAQDIASGNLALREGDRSTNRDLRQFARIKRNNLRDHADAGMRFLVASGIFVRDLRAQSLTYAVEGRADADFLLSEVGLEPLDPDSMSYDEYVLDYLGRADVPAIRRDDPAAQAEDIAMLTDRLAALEPSAAARIAAQFDEADTEERLQLLREAELTLVDQMEIAEAAALMADRQGALTMIDEAYATIADRTVDQVARPLAYEWNTWRAVVVANDALRVRGNFTRDVDGRPRSTAGPNMGDIEVEFGTFWLIVEVTLQTGQRQWESEGEPIMRHVGRLQTERRAAGDTRPVYGIFVAESLNSTTVAFLKIVANTNSAEYGGRVRIIPMARPVFFDLVRQIVEDADYAHTHLLDYLERLATAAGDPGIDEQEWLTLIGAGLQ
jgi:hypothetical protein